MVLVYSTRKVQPFDKSDDTWRSYTAANSHLSTDVIHKLATDDAGHIWIATQSGLNAYEDGQWMLFSMEQGLPANDISTFQINGQQLWLGTSNGFGVLDYGGTITISDDDQWQTYPISESLSSNVSAVGIDANGYLWSGVHQMDYYDGYSRVMVRDLNDTPFFIDDDQILEIKTQIIDDPRALTINEQGVWFAADEGIYQVTYTGSPLDEEAQQWRNDLAGSGLAHYTVNTIAPMSGDNILAGVDGRVRLLKYGSDAHDLRDDRWIAFDVSGGSIVAADQQNRFWLGNGSSLTVFDPGPRLDTYWDDESRFYDEFAGLEMAPIQAIVLDNADRAWIATGDYFHGGINILSAGESTEGAHDDQMATFTTQNSDLPGSFVTTVALGLENNVWIGTMTGAAHLQYGVSPYSKQDDQWATFTTANSGIAANHVRDIAVDAAGNVWFALATGGVSLYTSTGEWVTFTEDDGLALNSVNTVAIDHGGNLWFGTDGEGISILNTAGTVIEKSDDSWETLLVGDQLLSGYIRSIVVDSVGQVWIGSYDSGLSVYSNFEFHQLYLPVIRNPYFYNGQ